MPLGAPHTNAGKATMQNRVTNKEIRAVDGKSGGW